MWSEMGISCHPRSGICRDSWHRVRQFGSEDESLASLAGSLQERKRTLRYSFPIGPCRRKSPARQTRLQLECHQIVALALRFCESVVQRPFPGILLQGFIANRAGAQLQCHVREGQHDWDSTRSCISGTMTSRFGKADMEVCSGLNSQSLDRIF